MTKEDLYENVQFLMENITDFLEVDLNSPYLIIFASIGVLALNLFLLHKLSYLSHMHKL